MGIFNMVNGNLAADVYKAVNGAYDNANATIGKVNSQIGVTNSLIGEGRSAVAQAKASAANMGPYITNVSRQGDAVNATAGNLDANAETLTGYSKELAESGRLLNAEGAAGFADARNLMELNPNAGGLIGQYIDNINAFDPNALVSRAASDVQASMQNQTAQMERDLARRGVSPTSGAFVALRQKAARDTAVATAGAKTSYALTGLNQKNTVLRNALTDALNIKANATTTTNAGTTAINAAAGAEKSAADVWSAKGDLQYKAGALYDSAGQLVAKQGDLYNAAANASTGLANASTSAANAITNAGQMLAKAYELALQGARDIATGGRGGGGGGSSGGGGAKVTSAPAGDDADFHSTYEKNLKGTDYTPIKSNPNAKYYNTGKK